MQRTFLNSFELLCVILNVALSVLITGLLSIAATGDASNVMILMGLFPLCGMVVVFGIVSVCCGITRESRFSQLVVGLSFIFFGIAAVVVGMVIESVRV